jgi:rare lipoprotein A
VPHSRAAIGACALAALLLAACSGNVRDSAPSGSVSIPDLPDDAVPRPEPRSRYGNGPEYEVFGQAYQVMDSSSGYKERGVASWYGKKFHGRLTSNREPYDMYAMTAAHKTLPLPTYVKVRNLRNDRSIIVRVNDRGPFVHNRIIDLSYAAALKLDMIRDGTSLVEVTAISFDDLPRDRPVRVVEPAEPPAPQPVPAPRPETPPATPQDHEIFVQVGAFGCRRGRDAPHVPRTHRPDRGRRRLRRAGPQAGSARHRGSLPGRLVAPFRPPSIRLRLTQFTLSRPPPCENRADSHGRML